jgi:hypothetical protein
MSGVEGRFRCAAQVREPPRESRPRLDQADREPGEAARGQPSALVERGLGHGGIEPGAGVPDARLARAVEAAGAPRDGEAKVWATRSSGPATA